MNKKTILFIHHILFIIFFTINSCSLGTLTKNKTVNKKIVFNFIEERDGVPKNGEGDQEIFAIVTSFSDDKDATIGHNLIFYTECKSKTFKTYEKTGEYLKIKLVDHFWEDEFENCKDTTNNKITNVQKLLNQAFELWKIKKSQKISYNLTKKIWELDESN